MVSHKGFDVYILHKLVGMISTEFYVVLYNLKSHSYNYRTLLKQYLSVLILM